MTIKTIQDKIEKGEYRFSDHAVKRMIKKSIDRHDVEEALLGGEIIEEYPEDKYSPSCLIYGKTFFKVLYLESSRVTHKLKQAHRLTAAQT